jgi:hypothetical protein
MGAITLSDEIRYMAKRGTTNWHAYDLDALWQMLENEDNSVSWQQAISWMRAAQLCQDQATVLADALTKLQEHWPATPGSASEAFAAVVNELVTKMRTTVDDSHANYNALTSIIVDLGTTRSRIADLLDQHDAYRRQESQAYNPLASARHTGDPDWQPPSPPPPTWREDLNNEARTIMAASDANAAAQAENMRARIARDGGYDLVDYLPDPETGAGTGGATVPYVPMPTAALDYPAALDDPSYPHQSDPAVDPNTSTIDHGGLVTGGSSTASTAPILAGEVLTPATAPSSAGATPAGPWPDGVISPKSVAGSSGSGGYPSSAATTIPGSGGTAAPGGPRAATSAPAAKAGVNPLMTPPMTGVPRGARAGGAVQPGGHAPGYRDRKRKRDPRDPWAVPEGGPAVIEPQPDVDHDPGPGVIGIDR